MIQNCALIQSEEPVTLGPDSLIDSNPLSALEAIAAATLAHKTVEKTATNDVRHEPSVDPMEPLVHHEDSLAVEGSMVESRVPAPAPSTDLPEELAMTPKSEELPGALVTAAAAPAAEEEETTEESNDHHIPSTYRLHNLHDLGPDDEILEPEAAERNIEVSVSSSISSVSQSSGVQAAAAGKEDVVVAAPKKSTSAPAPFPPVPPQSSGNFLPIDKTAKPDAHFAPSGPLVAQEEPLDYDDYSNMELPPSLPNLEWVIVLHPICNSISFSFETFQYRPFLHFSFLFCRIIPFVAADAVMGVPNLEEDERLNLGGVVEQRTPISQSVSDEFSKTG